jgi:PAS domain S-box-containing protein
MNTDIPEATSTAHFLRNGDLSISESLYWPHTEEQHLAQFLVEHTLDAVYCIDPEGRIAYANNAACQAVDRAKEEINFLSFPEIDSYCAKDGWGPIWQKIISCGSLRFESTHRTKQGKTFPVEVTANHLSFQGKEYCIAYVRDIAERKQAESAVNELQARMKTLFEGVETGIFIIDPITHRIIAANPVALDMAGAPEDKIVGAVCHKFVCPAEAGRCPVTDLGQVVDNSERVLLTIKGEKRSIIKTVKRIEVSGKSLLLESFLDITDRKHSERALEEQTAYLNTLFEISPLGIVVLDNEMCMQKSNTTMERLFLYSREEMQGANLRDLLVPSDLVSESNELVAKCVSGKTVHFTTRRQRKDNVLLDVDIYEVPLMTAGKPHGVMALYQDVTERRQIEAEMSERHRLATLAAEIGVVLTGAASLSQALLECAEILVRNMNLTCARVWTLNEQIGHLDIQARVGTCPQAEGMSEQSFMRMFRIERIAQSGESYATNQLADAPWMSDPEWVRQEGLTSFVGHPLKVGEQILGVVAALARDPLTDAGLQAFESVVRSVAQFVERKRAEESLRASEVRYRDLFENASDHVYTFDLNMRITSLNRLAEQTIGYTQEEAKQINLRELVDAEHWAHIEYAIEQLVAGRASTKFQMGIKSKDGRRVTLEVNPRLICREGKPVGIQGIARDITGRDVAEMELRQAQKLESVGRLAAGIAHEINTPMQFVGDNLRFLQDSYGSLHAVIGKLQELCNPAAEVASPLNLTAELSRFLVEKDCEYILKEIPEALTQTLEGVERVVSIVRAMKEFAHPENKGMAKADLNRGLLNTLTVARNEIKYVAVVETDFGDLPLVNCNLSDLNQVFLNLLVNAAHAIGDVVKGTEQKGKIRIQTKIDGSMAVITITDTGGGIPEEIRDRIFDPFFTTKEVGRGTGQGLAIARSVVDRHRGSLTFESEVGKGTTFYVSLPIDNCESKAEGLSASLE